MSDTQLHREAERRLGGKITHAEMQAARASAQRKLDRINAAEGTAHGDSYLAILIAEAVNQSRFSKLTFSLHAEASKRDNGTKKEPHPKARPFNSHTHCIAP